MEIKGMQHCALVIADVEKSRWFYGEVLGLPEVPRPKTFTFGGAWFQCPNGDEIHLILAGDTSAPPGMKEPGPGKHSGLVTHLGFEVEDVDAVKAHLEAHDLEILGGPMMRGDGVMQMYLADPDGYMVEFFQWTEDAQTDAPERSPVRG